jgi:hypothetical protein
VTVAVPRTNTVLGVTLVLVS